MHRWRKLICYLVMPLVVAEKPIKGELPWPIFGGKNGKNLWYLLEGLNTWLEKGDMLPNYALVWPRSLERIGVTDKNGKKLRKYLYGRLRQCAMPRSPGFSERYFIVLIKARILLMFFIYFMKKCSTIPPIPLIHCTIIKGGIYAL